MQDTPGQRARTRSAVRAFGAGASGDHVRDLQRRLTSLGFTPGPADGEYGPRTADAVREFQRARGLDDDAICGADTWAALVEAGHRLGDRLLYLHSPMLRGDDVAELQQELASRGFDPGRIDAVLGPDTAAALVEFQRNTGLVPDGIGGPETIKMFARLPRRDVSSTDVSTVRERARLRAGPPTLSGRRIVVGERGGLDALSAAIHRALGEAGAEVVTLHHPDWEHQARQANAFGADVFIGLVIRDDERSVCHFASEHSESAAGRELAGLMVDELTAVLGPARVRGMRLPVLRATRMPAVLIRLGDARDLVPAIPAVARGLRRALAAWLASDDSS